MMSGTRMLLASVAVAGLLALPAAAVAHQSKPFTGATKDTEVIDRTTVRTTLEVANFSKHPKRARCTVVAYSGAQDTTTSKSVSMRVPPYRKGAGYHWVEERLTLRFDQGPIKPVSVTAPHCHRA